MSPAQGLRMSVQQVWSGLSTSQANPYYANIENLGPSENGVLTTSSDQSQDNIEYHIELPSGSKKRILFQAGGWNDGRVLLHTGSGIKEAPIKSSYSSEQSRIGLISDSPSDLIFLKTQQDTSGAPNNNGIGVGGCVPDDAPYRSMGYACLDSLVLGEGTERLRDDQIHAIKQFVRSGGVLVFVGGSAPSAMTDPRWRDFLPITNTTVITKNGLSERLGTPILNAKKIEVARGSAYVRSFGVGLVVAVSVNPFESPIRESDDRRAIVGKVVQRAHRGQVQQLIDSQIGTTGEYNGSYAVSATPPTVTGVPTPPPRGGAALPSAIATDPFEIKPPSLSSIMWVLMAYTVIVVPINFLILRKLNKLELAWVTTPVISVIFSAILLESTISLYKANATTRTTGLAVIDDRGGESTIFGRSEMFFPRAKSYDLELKGIEDIRHSTASYRSEGTTGVNMIDTGSEIVAPDVRTGNLNFKELSYEQTSNELAGVKISLVRSDGLLKLHVSNQSHSNISGLTLFGPAGAQTVQDSVKSGATRDFEIKMDKKTQAQDKNQPSISWQSVASNMPNHLVVFAYMDSMQVGPKYGAGHPSSSYSIVAAPNLEGRP